ncbi:MAG: M6 family metalloprotease domain-containing protein [Bacteroidales bacterium]|nr:M6 family metalloprotease domain-containing protein [Bacteroidales bacterium]
MISALILSAALSVWAALDTLKVPCVLLEFTDVKFEGEAPEEYFDALLNEEGFSGEGLATGSVRDYFRDNSLGAFIPVFDVYGPVTLPRYRAFYGRDVVTDGVRADAAADQALAEACAALDEDVDFSVYDADSDGVLDMILFIYAGLDQSQGGPQDAIWAHNWYLSKSASQDLREVVLDGVRLDGYFCASELRGKDGKTLSGIGHISHEFGHALGLPDFYDQAASGSQAAADPGEFALMCYGATNNFGFTPPYLTAEERMMLGWMTRESLQELQPGKQVLSAIEHNTAYVIPTETEGEYFLLEYRDSKMWDAPLPEGLVLYHVDRSEAYAPRWDNWIIPGSGVNDDSSHPCFYIVPSYNGVREAGNMVFPGISEATSIEPQGWNGSYVSCQITNIELTPDGVSVYAQFDCGPNINGYVRDVYGYPVEGADVSVGEEVTLSGPDGHFFVPVEDGKRGSLVLNVSAPGYRNFSTRVSLGSSRVLSVPVTLRRNTEGDDNTLSKYDFRLKRGYYNKSGIGAVRFTPSDLAPYAGSLLKEIVFYPYLLNSFQGEIYVTVDIGRERVLTKLVETPVYGLYFKNSVDVTDAGIVIPEGEDLYVGYGGSGGADGSFYLGTVYPGDKKNSYWAPFSTERSSWSPLYVERADITMNLMLEAQVQEQVGAQNLSSLGYFYISPGKGNWQEGDTFLLELVSPENGPEVDVMWFYDEEKARGSVVLESGYHVLEAVLEYNSGVTETIRKEFNIK